MNRIILSGTFCGLLALVGCANATEGSDAGEGGGSYVTGPGDAGDGGAAGDASDAAVVVPECVPPGSATMIFSQTEAGITGCMPQRSAPFNCADLTTSFKLVCTAPDPSNIPSAPLGCDLASNLVGGAANNFYCCPCM